MVGLAVPHAIDIHEVIHDGVRPADEVRLCVASHLVKGGIDIRHACLIGHSVDDALVAGLPFLHPCGVGAIFGVAHHGVVAKHIACGQEVHQSPRRPAYRLRLPQSLRLLFGEHGRDDGTQRQFVVLAFVDMVVVYVQERLFFGDAHLAEAPCQVSEIGLVALRHDHIGRGLVCLLRCLSIHHLIVGKEVHVGVTLLGHFILLVINVLLDGQTADF